MVKLKITVVLLFVLSFCCANISTSTANDFSEVVSYLDLNSQKYSISDFEARALRQYTAMYHITINSGLRTENVDVVNAMASRICSVDSLISRFPISYPKLILYRGHDHLSAGGDKVGAELIERSFLSTSVSQDIASRFLKDKKTPVLDEISFSTDLVPGLWVHPLSLIKDEYEVLLARGLNFRVLAIEKRNSWLSPPITVRRLIAVGPGPTNPKIEQALSCPSGH